jgi:hypothetical protein
VGVDGRTEEEGLNECIQGGKRHRGCCRCGENKEVGNRMVWSDARGGSGEGRRGCGQRGDVDSTKQSVVRREDES